MESLEKQSRQMNWATGWCGLGWYWPKLNPTGTKSATSGYRGSENGAELQPARNGKMKKSSKKGAVPAGVDRAETTQPHGQIASKLKALYQTVENEPVPQHFLDLLHRLDEAEERPRE